MEKMRVSFCIAVTCAASWALVTAYHIAPRTAAMSGWTRLPPSPNYYVSEVLTVSFDEPRGELGTFP